jgi:hypothetical protein
VGYPGRGEGCQDRVIWSSGDPVIGKAKPTAIAVIAVIGEKPNLTAEGGCATRGHRQPHANLGWGGMNAGEGAARSGIR